MMALALWADGTVTAIAQNADSFDPNAVGGIEGVIAMAVQSDGNIIIGGDFTNVGGMARSNLARLKINGTLDTSFDPEPNGAIYGLAVQADGMILVSGFFTALSGVTRNRIARLNSDGTLDASFNPGVTGDVYGVLVQGDGKIIVWGEFSQLAGQPLNRIGRLNSNGTLDTSFDPGSGANDSIFTVALQADGKMVVSGYHFSNLAGHACNGIGRLNADGSFDTSFNADSVFGVQNDSNLNVVYNLLVQPDQRILLAGAARAWGSIFYGYLLRLKADGSLDSSFQRQSTDDLISAMALQSDGKVLIGGRFAMLSGQSRSNIARINANGSPDNSFNPGATDHHVQGLSVQADGNILVGGNFTTLAGQPRNYIGRLTNMGMVQQSFAVNAKGTALTWQRSGPGPELQQVTFEQSNDGSNYTFLGNCKYSRGGWQLAGLSVPAVQTFYLRARGQAVGGYFSASSGLIEQIAQIYWVPPPAVFLDNGALRYTFSGTSNTSFSVFATTNLNLVSSNWILLGPAAYLGDGYYQYADLAATNFPQRFYRGVGQ
jgi:uncharacterized delta-60 repeat protein